MAAEEPHYETLCTVIQGDDPGWQAFSQRTLHNIPLRIINHRGLNLCVSNQMHERRQADAGADCGFRSNWSSDSGGNWSAIPVGSGPGFRWELVQFLMAYRNGGPLTGIVDHMTGTVDQIAGIGQV